MRLEEFKAWFEGFTEGMKGSPSEKQWKRIRERVSEIEADPERVVERYYTRPWWPTWYTYTTTTPATDAPPFTVTWCNNAATEIGRTEAASFN